MKTRRKKMNEIWGLVWWKEEVEGEEVEDEEEIGMEEDLGGGEEKWEKIGFFLIKILRVFG